MLACEMLFTLINQLIAVIILQQTVTKPRNVKDHYSILMITGQLMH